jgi:microcystin-dependent protein
MPRNGSGTYSLPQPPFVAGTVISSAAVNSDFSDIASALTGSLPRDGQAGMTGALKAADGSSVAPSITFSNELGSGFSRSGTGIISVNILGVQIATITSAGWVGPVQGGVQVGTVADFAGSTAPAQWYLCFGQAVSRTTFSALFAIIGTTYGVGDGSTTFNLPDLRGYVVAGVDNMGGSAAGRLTSTFYGANPDVLGTAGGVQQVTLTAGQIPGITSSAVNSITVTSTRNIPSTAGPITSVPTVSTGTLNVPLSGSGGPDWSTDSTMSGNNTITVSSTNTSGLPHGIIQPTIVLNKIIFAGV